MSADLIQAALKDILAQKQDHTAGSVAYQRMERAEAALLALAERTLEPQGQALPDDCDVRKIMLRVDPGPDGMGVEVYAQNVGEVEALLSELGDKAEEAYASQLALPAGPVPENVRHALNEWADAATSALQWLRNIADGTTTDHQEAIENTLSGIQHAQQVTVDALASPSPAVAQPVLSDEDAELLRQAKELHDAFTEAIVPREGTLLERMQYLGRYVVALKDAEAKAAVAQPVADEDSKRINWLEANNQVVGYAPSGDWAVFSNNYGVAGVMYYGKTWRAAVDAARAALCQPAEEGGKS